MTVTLEEVKRPEKKGLNKGIMKRSRSRGKTGPSTVDGSLVKPPVKRTAPGVCSNKCGHDT